MEDVNIKKNTFMLMLLVHDKKIRKIFFVAIGILAVLLIVGIGLGYYFFVYKKAEVAPAPYVSISILPASTLYRLDTQKNVLIPVTAPGQVKDTEIIDELKVNDATYYLITSIDQSTSNIFVSKKGAPIVQVTNSATFKYDLSYDASSNSFAYMSGDIANLQDLFEKTYNNELSATVAALGANGGVQNETVIATSSSHAEIVPKANMVVIEKQDGLYAYPLNGSLSKKIYSSENAIPFAVSHTGMLAIYNSATHAVDMYRAGEGLNKLSYVSSQKLSLIPTTLGFKGDELMLGASRTEGKKFLSVFSIPEVSESIIVTNPEQNLQHAMPQKIVYE